MILVKDEEFEQIKDIAEEMFNNGYDDSDLCGLAENLRSILDLIQSNQKDYDIYKR